MSALNISIETRKRARGDERANDALSKKIGEIIGTGELELPDYIDPDKFGNDIRDSLDKLVYKQGIQSFKAHLVNYFLSLGVLEHNRMRREIIQSAVNQVKLKKDTSSRIKIDGKEYILFFDGHVGRCVNVSVTYPGVNETFTWTMGYNTDEMDEGL